jgi:hypothetical protein
MENSQILNITAHPDLKHPIHLTVFCQWWQRLSGLPEMKSIRPFMVRYRSSPETAQN